MWLISLVTAFPFHDYGLSVQFIYSGSQSTSFLCHWQPVDRTICNWLNDVVLFSENDLYIQLCISSSQSIANYARVKRHNKF